ncbi:MAG: hypothetical protein RIC55_06440 [Pirellulaceae bacterium]
MYGNQPPLKFLTATLGLAIWLTPTLAGAWQLQAIEPAAEQGAAEPDAGTEPDAGALREVPRSSRRGGEGAPAAPPVVQAAPVARDANTADVIPSEVETDADEEIVLDVQTASFKGLVPGKSTIEDIEQKLGEPESFTGDAQQAQLTYRVPPLPKVEFLLNEGVVTSIVIHLSRPTTPPQIAKELGVSAFRPAPIADETGRTLGQAYPERGVLFVLGDDPQQPGVSHIVLEPITAEPFILRVQADVSHRYRECLADLDYAQQLTPDDARIYAQRAEILGAIGRIDEALENMSSAVKLEGTNIQHRLHGARLLVRAGEIDRALVLAKAIAEHDAVDVLTRAQAELLWGDILATGANGDFHQATPHHTKAVELAAPVAAGKTPHLRRAARQVVLEGHLAVARDIALGNWRNKDATVQRWLTQAAKIARDAVLADGADPMLEFVVQRGALAALAGTAGKADAGAIADGAVKLIGEQLDAGVDPLYRKQLQWELGEALFDASRAEHSRGSTDTAIAYGKQALELLEKAAAERDAEEMKHYLLGRVCFRIGSYYAVGKSDHEQALAWYQKSLLHFAEPLPVSLGSELGLHGERYVSMGASYWKAGQQDAGVQLTEQGVKWIKQAVDDGRTPEATLAIPYGNLAAMHRQLGHEDQAKAIANLAERIDAETPQKR